MFKTPIYCDQFDADTSEDDTEITDVGSVHLKMKQLSKKLMRLENTYLLPGIPKAIPKRVTKRVTTGVPKQNPNQNLKQNPKQNLKRVPKQNTKQNTKQNPKPIRRNTSEHIVANETTRMLSTYMRSILTVNARICVHASTLTDMHPNLKGCEGVITAIPVYPATWYSVLLDSGVHMKLRMSSFEMVTTSKHDILSSLDAQPRNNALMRRYQRSRLLNSLVKGTIVQVNSHPTYIPHDGFPVTGTITRNVLQNGWVSVTLVESHRGKWRQGLHADDEGITTLNVRTSQISF